MPVAIAVFTKNVNQKALGQGGRQQDSNTKFLLTQSPSLLQKCTSAPGDGLGAAVATCFQPAPCSVSLQALFKLWGSSDLYPKDVLTYTELVLDSQGHLVQMNRLPGGNEVAGSDLGAGGWEAALPPVGTAGGFPVPAVHKAWEMLPKQELCLSALTAPTSLLWRSQPCDTVPFWDRWGWLPSK